MVKGDANRYGKNGTEEMRVYIHTFGVKVRQAVEGGEDGFGSGAVMPMYVVIILLPGLEFIPMEEVRFGLGGVG